MTATLDVPQLPVDGSHSRDPWSTLPALPSHRRLLPAVSRRIPTVGPDVLKRAFDVVVVPTVRCGLQLQHAATVARRSGAVLLVLASRTTVVEEALKAILDTDPRSPVVVVDTNGYRLPVLLQTDVFSREWATDHKLPRLPDTARKRNLALLLARRIGWGRMLFMDDDVNGLVVDELAVASRAFERGYRAAAWRAVDYPDHSAAYHAYRLRGDDLLGRIEPFVGGGAMAVKLAGLAPQQIPFFPRVYNEDWFFLHDFVRSGTLADVGSVRQNAYNPFAKTDRARVEEFGDLVAEGLFATMHWRDHRGARLPDLDVREVGYWKGYIDTRQMFLSGLRDRIDPAGGSADLAMHKSVTASLEELATITPDDPVRFIDAWRADRVSFSSHLSQVTVLKGSLERRITAALSEAGFEVELRTDVASMDPPWTHPVLTARLNRTDSGSPVAASG